MCWLVIDRLSRDDLFPAAPTHMEQHGFGLFAEWEME
jgi:hypothetical protein